LESRCGVSHTFPAIKISIRMNTMDMKYAKQKQNNIKFWFEATRKIKVRMAWKYYVVPPENRPSTHDVA